MARYDRVTLLSAPAAPSMVPALVVPSLGAAYALLSPWFEGLLRFAAGIALLPHALQKLFGFFRALQFPLMYTVFLLPYFYYLLSSNPPIIPLPTTIWQMGLSTASLLDELGASQCKHFFLSEEVLLRSFSVGELRLP